MSDDFKNMRIKLFEEFGNSQQIHISIKGGNVLGIRHTKREYFESWIIQEELDDESRGFFAMFPDSKLLSISILNSINVEGNARGKGLGNSLMRAFLNVASDAKNVVLIANTKEHNNFDIIKWYTGWGFIQIGHARKYPVMVLNNY